MQLDTSGSLTTLSVGGVIGGRCVWGNGGRGGGREKGGWCREGKGHGGREKGGWCMKGRGSGRGRGSGKGWTEGIHNIFKNNSHAYIQTTQPQNMPWHPSETIGNAHHHLLKEIDTGHHKLQTLGRGRRHETTSASPGTGVSVCSPLTAG